MSLEELLRVENQSREALEEKNVDRLWQTWCSAAEAYLTRRSGGQILLEDASLYCGRGRVRKPRKMFTSACQSPTAGEAISLRQRQLQKLVRQIEELCRQMARLTGSGPGVEPWELRRLWHQIRTHVALWLPSLQGSPLVSDGSILLSS